MAELTCRICGHIGDEFSVIEAVNKLHNKRSDFSKQQPPILTRYRCCKCKVIFGPIETIEYDRTELSRLYRNYYRLYSEPDQTAKDLKLFQRFRPTKDKAYLNFGAGIWSKCNKRLVDRGWNIYGYDPIMGDGDRIARNMRDLPLFDGIFSKNVLEHLQDPVGEFLRMKEHLKEKGYMIHQTPCYDYKVAFTPLHLYFFTGQALKYLCDRTGFTFKRIKKDIVIFRIDKGA